MRNKLKNVINFIKANIPINYPIYKNKLNKISITKKLFLITTLVFVAYITTTFVIQSLFFQRFYIYKKSKELITHTDSFKSAYKSASTDDKIQELLADYEDNYNIKIFILDKSNTEIARFKTLGSSRPDAKFFLLKSYVDNLATDKNLLSQLKQSTNTHTKEYRNLMTKEKFIISTSYDKTNDSLIFSLTSLQPVNEAASVTKEFYFYFYIGSFFFILLLSYIYTNMIGKPLVVINKVATKMAHLDFTEKCTVQNQDEIGNVASSLNFLSENLDTALTSLRSANAKLEKDIEKERNLEKMRKEFIASVSHELKTPITLIDGYAVGLKDDIFEGEEKDYYLDIIIDEAKKMGSLVSDMLDLSQLESGTFKLTKDYFSMDDLILFTLKKYAALINEKSITLKTELIEKVKVYADWNRMEQVITNFITNALRHVDENGTINILMINNGSNISIEVENTGSHISEQDIEKVWDKFYKIDKARTRKLGGTGIGLSIVKNILQLHDYNYGVQNTETGVKFYFQIPIKGSDEYEN